MPNENKKSTQTQVTVKRPSTQGSSYVFASAQSSPSPTDKKEPVPIAKPKKKGK